jgi:spore coat polysaccharide biosynthesis protein SpsF
MVRAAKQARGVDEVVIATSVSPGDDAVADLAGALGVRAIRGSEDDVLSRFALVARETGADAVMRLTADCPLHDPAQLTSLAALWRSNPELDYCSTVLVRTVPHGYDAEITSAAALAKADAEATGYHRSHVNSWFYAGPGGFATAGLVIDPPANDLRVTLDTPADAEFLDAVVAELGDKPPALREVIALLRARPDIVAINADVKQKVLAEG